MTGFIEKQIRDFFKIDKWTIILLVLLIIKVFTLGQYKVPTGSMYPTIVEGDLILSNNLAYGLRVPIFNIRLLTWDRPKKGEIVVFEPPHTTDAFVKRLIAVGGDKVEIEDGHIYVNGVKDDWNPEATELQGLYKELEFDSERNKSFDIYLASRSMEDGIIQKHWIRFAKSGSRSLVEKRSFIVPEGKLFFVGDNRDESSDGRTWGFADENKVYGRAMVVAASFKPSNYPIDIVPRSGRFWHSLYH